MWGWAWQGTSLNPQWIPKIRNLCYAGDFFCQAGTGSNAMAIHNSYNAAAMLDAKAWVEHMLSAG